MAAEKPRRINRGNTNDQCLLIEIRNAIEDLTRALKVPNNSLALARQIREVRAMADDNARRLDEIVQAQGEDSLDEGGAA